ncbi:MAG TPA: hypothetical protein VE783_04905 [Candidatus Limnocylindrales bacterium]|jgi:hypothetical protein|nr:hypothetical protein [Candidatus Limnocylindrales bacterium]
MPRWLTFDSRTASRLRQQLGGEQVFEHGASDALDYALNLQTSTVTVLPTEVPGQAAVVVIRPVSYQRTAAASALPSRREVRLIAPEDAGSYQAGGILGLRDERLYEDETPVEAKKKNWWQRFWDES